MVQLCRFFCKKDAEKRIDIFAARTQWCKLKPETSEAIEKGSGKAAILIFHSIA
jgi:hypothetical protein